MTFLSVTQRGASDGSIDGGDFAVHRLFRLLLQISAVAVAVAFLAGFPWLSASASVPTPLQSAAASSVASLPSSSLVDCVGVCVPVVSPSCDSSQGLYLFPSPGSASSSPSLPSWVSSSASPLCVLVGDALVYPIKTTPSDPAPSPVTAIQSLQTTVLGFRELILFSIGIIICLVAALFMRARSSR